MHVIKCKKDTEVHKRRHFKSKGNCHFREVERLYIIDLFEGMRVISSDVGFVSLLSWFVKVVVLLYQLLQLQKQTQILNRFIRIQRGSIWNE